LNEKFYFDSQQRQFSTITSTSIMTEQPNGENFIRFYSKYEGQIRAYLRSLLPTWDDVDEVIQNVAVVLWKKIEQFDPDTEFMKWACIVAKYEVLSYRRSKARDRLSFSDEVFEIMAEEGREELEQREDELRVLESCVQKLKPAQTKLIQACYTRGLKVKDLASDMRTSPGALYERLNLIRKKLHVCMSLQLGENG
jgi:RNA polymerase sigma-70 factor (ECF subfamily)